MRIFFVTHRTPWPPFKGSQVRAFNILKAMAARGHEIELFSFANEGDPNAARDALAKWSSKSYLADFSTRSALVRTALAIPLGTSLSESWFGSSALRAAISRAAAERPPDAFFVHSSSMAQYVPATLRSHSVCDMCDVDSKKWTDLAPKSGPLKSIAYSIEARRLAWLEYRIVREFAGTTLATSQEAELLTDLSASERGKIVVVTNGTDLEYFRPDAWREEDLSRLPDVERPHFSGPRNRICFTGAMDYPPNAEAATFFAQQVLPRVRKRVPDAEFLVVGSKPTNEVRALAQLPGVRVTGFVQDARPYFNLSPVFVAPLLLARGVQNKALEAMACGSAIVTTSMVARGVGARHREQLLVADSVEDMAEHSVRLLRDPAERHLLGTSARSFVETHYAWKPLMDRMLDFVEQAAASRPAS